MQLGVERKLCEGVMPHWVIRMPGKKYGTRDLCKQRHESVKEHGRERDNKILKHFCGQSLV